MEKKGEIEIETCVTSNHSFKWHGRCPMIASHDWIWATCFVGVQHRLNTKI